MSDFLGRNLVPKLVAILAALVLWVFVMNEQNPPLDGTFQVAVTARNLAEDMVVLESPATVRVKVRGLRNAIAGSSNRDFRASVDLKGLAAGQYNLPVTVSTPGGYDLVEVIPDKVPIRLDVIRSRQYNVEARLSGPLVGELSLGQVDVRPTVITVTGPSSRLELVEKVLAPVEIRGRTPAFSQKSRVILLGPDGHELRNLTVEPEQVTVAGNLEQAAIAKRVEVKTLTVGNLPADLVLRRIFTEPVQVEIKGPRDIVERVGSISTDPVSLEGITQDVTREVSLQLPPGISVERKTVMVRITVGKGP